MNRSAAAAVAWAHFQPRTVVLAQSLKGAAMFITGDPIGRRPILLPWRYLACAIDTWRRLERQNPEVVVVITPPVFAPLIVWAWSALRHRRFVIDCHTDTFHSREWSWATGLHRLLFRAASAVLVHTEEAEVLVRSWGAPVLLLPDDVPDVSQALPQPRGTEARVLIAGGLDDQEPVRETIQAARLLPAIQFRLTGDESRVPLDVRLAAPPNVVFTGYLAYPRFLGEMQAADVVAAFSLDPHIMNRAAFEAIGLGCPLVLSDLPGLRSRFAAAAVYCRNTPQAMAEALSDALRQRPDLARRSTQAQDRLRGQHVDAVNHLLVSLNLRELEEVHA